jgi:hypothetical protein
MKLRYLVILCLLALQACAGTPADSGGPTTSVAAPSAGGDRCQPMFGRPSPFVSCRDS